MPSVMPSPTVIIFWTFVEILGRWDMLTEIWVEPSHYWLEMTMMAVAFLVFTGCSAVQT